MAARPAAAAAAAGHAGRRAWRARHARRRLRADRQAAQERQALRRAPSVFLLSCRLALLRCGAARVVRAACALRRAAASQRGTTVSEDPEEEKKQKEIKGLLNKITPEKYETIREKLMASGIDNAKTLRGLIDQARSPALRGAGGAAARRASALNAPGARLVSALAARPRRCSTRRSPSRPSARSTRRCAST